VQHALRAFTPDDATNLAKAVRTYPKTDDYDLSQLLTQLGTGEAIVTVLSERGAPTPDAWARMRTPRSLMGQIDAAAQQQAVTSSPIQAKYGTAVDRESAYEKLSAKLVPGQAPGQDAPAAQPQREAPQRNDHGGMVGEVINSSAFKSFARSAATVLGREITRSIFGSARRRR
jgi:hypothetical protein